MSRLFEPTAEERRRAIIENTRDLLAHGESPHHIAHRLGYANPRSLEDILDRWGEHSLARRMRTVVAA